MQTIPYMLMQDSLSTGGSFIMCDCNAPGFPIQYASAGFCDLFGHTAAACKGKKCGDLVAEGAIRSHDPTLERLAKAVGMTTEKAGEVLSRFTQYAAQECRAMMARTTEVTGFALVPNITKTGTLKVIELAMVVCRHPEMGWLYTVGLQSDVTRDVPLKTLFAAMGDGSYGKLVKAQEPVMKERFHLLQMPGAAKQYLDDKAGEMWESLMMKAFGEDFKPLSEVSLGSAGFAEVSTAEDDDASSWKNSTDSASVATKPKWDSGKADASTKASTGGGSKVASTAGSSRHEAMKLSRTEGEPRRQLSTASTSTPEMELQAFSRHGTDEVPSGSPTGSPRESASAAATPRASAWAPDVLEGDGPGSLLTAGAGVACGVVLVSAIVWLRAHRS